jgi:hypothetical protein
MTRTRASIRRNFCQFQIALADRRERILSSLAILSIVVVGWACFPAPPGPIGTGLDASWMWGLNMAHQQGLTAGRDFVYTLGPLAYLFFPSPGSTGPVELLVCWAVLYLGWMGVLARLFRVASRTVAWGVALTTGFVMLGLGPPPVDRLEVTILTLALLPLVDRVWRYRELAVLAILSGLSTLVKLNLGVEAGVILCCMLTLAVREEWPLSARSRRRLITVAVLFPVSTLAAYWLSTGKLLPFVDYLRQSLEIVSGYSEAMSLAGPLWQVILAVLTLTGICCLLLIAENPRVLLPGIVPALVVGYFAFKHAMVRQDAHVTAFQFRAALGAMFVLVAARTARDRRLVLLLQGFSLVMGFTIVKESEPVRFADMEKLLSLAPQKNYLRSFRHWSGTLEQVESQSTTMLAALRLDQPWQQAVGRSTIDAVPLNIDQIKANGWNWLPRPVIQSHNAYTPELDGLNAVHLESNKASEHILLTWLPIDGHHPFTEDPASWRALLDRYDLEFDSYEQLLLLRRRPVRRFNQMIEFGSATATWNTDVILPRTKDILVMSAHTHRSLRGSLRKLLFRLSPAYLEVTYHSGKRLRVRATISNLSNGIIINPFPRKLGEVASLLGGCDTPEDQAVAVRFESDNPAEFRRIIELKWYRLPLRVLAAPHPETMQALTPIWLPQNGPPAALGAQLIQRSAWLEVGATTVDPQLTFHSELLGKFETVVIRAKFARPGDRIDFFFGRQVAGRGLSSDVPEANRWLDVYINAGLNPYWRTEHGTNFRFDPASEEGLGSHVEIAGVWGQAAPPHVCGAGVSFYPVAEPSAAGK